MTRTELVDASLYTGYITNYASLVERYGTTYYSIRLAGIFPGKIFAAFFGPDNGYYVTRYWILAIGVFSFFSIVRRYQSRVVSIVATIFFCFSPLYLRSVTWEYIDGIAIGYILASFALVLCSSWRWRSNMLAAGFCASLATNTNLFTLLIMGTFIPTVLALRDSLKWRVIAAEAFLTITGFVSGYLLMAFGLHVIQPGLGIFFESTAFKIGGALISGRAQVWFEPLSSFFSKPENLYAISPVVILAAAICVLLRPSSSGQQQSRRILAAFALYLALIVALYVIFYYLFHSAVITSIFYLSYLAIPCYLVLSAIIGYATRGLSASEILVWLYSAAILLVGLWALDTKLQWQDWVFPGLIAGVTGLFLVTCVAGLYWPRFLLLGVLIFILAAPAVFLRAHEDYGVLQSPSDAELNRDVRRTTLELISDIERLAPPSSGSIGFWYDKNVHPLRAVQSAYLYEYSLLPSVPPVVDAGFRNALDSRRFLVVLALTQQNVASNVAALEAAGIKSDLITQKTFSGKALDISYTLLELHHGDDGHGALVQSLPVESAILNPEHAVIARDSAGLTVRTDRRRWFYTMTFQLPKNAARENLIACARLKVLSGSIGIAAISDVNQRFDGEREIAPRAKASDYCIPLPIDSTQVVIRNWAPHGASDFVVERMGLYQKAN